MVTAKEGKISNSKAEGSFIFTDFSNWKDATSKFRKHQDSDCYKEDVERKVKFPRETMTLVKFSQQPIQRRKHSTVSSC